MALLALIAATSPLWYTIIGAAIAVIGSIVASVVVSLTTLKAVDKAQAEENRRALAGDRAHLRDLKGERLRELYAPLINYSLLLKRVGAEKGTSPVRPETRETMNARHDKEMADGRAGVEAVRARILVETGTENVWKAYETTAMRWWTVHESIRDVIERHGSHNDRVFNEILGEAQTAAEDLRKTALDQLAQYERPVEASMVTGEDSA